MGLRENSAPRKVSDCRVFWEKLLLIPLACFHHQTLNEGLVMMLFPDWQTRETFPDLHFGKSEMSFYSNSSCKTLAVNSTFSFPCFNGLWIWDKTGSIGQREKPDFQRTLFQGSLHSSAHTKLAPHSYHAKIIAVIIWMAICLLLNHLCLLWDKRHPLNGMKICI